MSDEVTAIRMKFSFQVAIVTFVPNLRAMQILQSGKGLQSRKPSSGITQDKASAEKTRRGKKQPEVVDKLDKLVAEYRTKYFNTPTGSKSEGDADLKRWFE